MMPGVCERFGAERLFFPGAAQKEEQPLVLIARIVSLYTLTSRIPASLPLMILSREQYTLLC
jgi:hypothetical protein